MIAETPSNSHEPDRSLQKEKGPNQDPPQTSTGPCEQGGKTVSPFVLCIGPVGGILKPTLALIFIEFAGFTLAISLLGFAFAIAHSVCSTQRFLGGRGKEGEGPKTSMVSESKVILKILTLGWDPF